MHALGSFNSNAFFVGAEAADGVNGWNCFGPTVTEEEVKANTDCRAKNIRQFGWEYIVVDGRWYVENTTALGYNQTKPIFTMDDFGRFWPAVNRFPLAKDGKSSRKTPVFGVMSASNTSANSWKSDY